MSGFGFAIAGALEGAGKGIVEEAIALREHAFREAEAESAKRRSMELDDHQNANLMAREERSRAYESGEAEKRRTFEAGENEKGRRQYLNDEEGNLNIIEGDKARPVLGADGKPLRSPTLTGKNATDFDKKYALGLEIYGDKEKAANFAAGVKDVTAQEREKMAQTLAKERSQSPMGGTDPKKFDGELERARKEIDMLFSDSTQRKPASAATTNEEPGKGSAARVQEMDEKAIKQQFPDAKKGNDGRWYVQGQDGKWRPVVAGQ